MNFRAAPHVSRGMLTPDSWHARRPRRANCAFDWSPLILGSGRTLRRMYQPGSVPSGAPFGTSFFAGGSTVTGLGCTFSSVRNPGYPHSPSKHWVSTSHWAHAAMRSWYFFGSIRWRAMAWSDTRYVYSSFDLSIDSRHFT